MNANTKPNKFKWKSSLFRTYFSLIMVLMVVLMVTSLVVVNALRKEEESSNRRFTAYFSTALENNLKGIGDFAYSILHSNYTHDILSIDDPELQKDKLIESASGMRRDLYVYKNSNPLIEDVIEYVPSLDLIIGINGYYSSRVYYKSGAVFTLNPAFSEEDFQNWMTTLFSDKSPGFYFLNGPGGERNIFYYCSIPYPLNKNDKRVVTIMLKEEGLRELLENLVVMGEYEYAAIADSEGAVFASYSKENFPVDPGFKPADFHSRDYLAITHPSSNFGFQCITIQKHGTAYSILNTVVTSLTVCAVISLAAGLIMALLFSVRNYTKLRKVAELFRRENDDLPDPSLEFIGSQIDLLITNNRAVMDAAERQQTIIDFSFLKDMLSRTECEESELSLLLTLYNEDFDNDTFILLAAEHRTDLGLDHETLQSLRKEFETEDFRILYTDFPDASVLLCNYDHTQENGRISALTQWLASCGTGTEMPNTAVSSPTLVYTDLPGQWLSLRRRMNLSAGDAPEAADSVQKAAQSLDHYRNAAEEAKKIIDQEYANSQLGLQMLAERLSVSQAYLSRVFKEKYSVSVMKYINYIRIQNAKELMVSGNDSLKVIALKTGFLSDINFIRVFKKYEQTTPGTYRSSQGNQV